MRIVLPLLFMSSSVFLRDVRRSIETKALAVETYIDDFVVVVSLERWR